MVAQSNSDKVNATMIPACNISTRVGGKDARTHTHTTTAKIQQFFRKRALCGVSNVVYKASSRIRSIVAGARERKQQENSR